MLDVTSSQKTSVEPRHILRSPLNERVNVLPPVIDADLALQQDETLYPAAIFGTLPQGFDPVNADIRTLAHWLRKAMNAVDSRQAHEDAEADNDALSNAMKPVNLLFKTIKEVAPRSPACCVYQMRAIADFSQWLYDPDNPEPSDDVMEDLSVAEFRHIAINLEMVVKCDEPTKQVGPLTKGRRLTRAGLLLRYHAFLVGELHTLSLNLYGSSDYALRRRPIDRAVSIRVSNNFVDGQYVERRKNYPFFDEGRLSQRARAVLESLEIDTVHGADRTAKRRTGGG
ncbi:hypothetical protein [Tardiphaga sp.]|uniref:hypothetical protein n=1 Tax=Tardiphaga sp. TaxID=1926292 RepID=UPI00262F5D3C|nr:hypothetical protein [Tardiphaga sp.]MDB5619505.1 hypothetical protein [Tardiphaga sp.]